MGPQQLDENYPNFSPNNRQRHEENMDYRKFIDTLYVLLRMVWGEDWGQLIIKRPTTSELKNIDMPIIVYSLMEMRPGQVGNSSVEISPRQRESFTVLDEHTNKKHSIQVLGQMMDCYIEFVVYEENNQKAMNLSTKFMEVMNEYKGTLMEKGMQNMWFEKEYGRNVNESGKDSMASRAILYRVRLEQLTERNVTLLEGFSLEIDTVYNKLVEEGKLPSQQI